MIILSCSVACEDSDTRENEHSKQTWHRNGWYTFSKVREFQFSMRVRKSITFQLGTVDRKNDSTRVIFKSKSNKNFLLDF